MCLAAYRPAGDKAGYITREDLENARASGNDDSYGLMYAQGGRLHIWKTADGKGGFNEFVSRVEKVQRLRVPFAVHCRLATHGVIDTRNAHPVEVLPERVAIVHNGIISATSYTKSNLSDTVHFAKILRQLPRRWWRNKAIIDLLEEYIGAGNKIVVMAHTGESVILNKEQGHWRNGVWFSNHAYQDYGRSWYYGSQGWTHGSGSKPAWYDDWKRAKESAETNGGVVTLLPATEKPVPSVTPEKAPEVVGCVFNDKDGTSTVLCLPCHWMELGEEQAASFIWDVDVAESKDDPWRCDLCSVELGLASKGWAKLTPEERIQKTLEDDGILEAEVEREAIQSETTRETMSVEA